MDGRLEGILLQVQPRCVFCVRFEQTDDSSVGVIIPRLGPETGYRDRNLLWFSLVFQINARFLSHPFQIIRHSTILSEQLAGSLNKSQVNVQSFG